MTETTKTHVILLACGSFNPITKGHIQMFGGFGAKRQTERAGAPGCWCGIQRGPGKGDRCLSLSAMSGHQWVNDAASLLLYLDPKTRKRAHLDPEEGTRRSL
ncbi:hypothetical protein CB1_001919003 [Camelus ferus]|nr:hypothetical protein CB1_001919003 [Camelus ferus]